MAALNAANGRANVAIELPKEAAPKLEPGTALPKGFIAPPRTIADITAILDSEKPNEKLLAELKADADSMPTGKESRADLAQFYFDRANARAQLGRLAESIADASKAVEVGRGAIDANMMGRLMQLLALKYSATDDPKRALDVTQKQLRDTANTPGAKGHQFSANRAIAALLVQMGDIAQAEGYLRRSLTAIQEARTSGLPGWRKSYSQLGQNWESELENTRAMIFEARGQFAEAEAAYRVAEQRKRAGMKGVMDSDNPPAETVVLQSIDNLVLSQARMKARQGRLAEAESGWKPAKNLIVVTNGALGLLPLSLLPTAPAEVAADEDPLFVGYRNVPWLARTHAVSTVPSAAALRTLRQLPPDKPGRGDLVAFGDPYFNREQQAEAEGGGEKVQVADAGGNVTRGGPLKRRNSPKLEGVDSAELGLLPRLPDTADELKSIALALQADPSKVLFLGATESAVKTMNLSGFRILAFAIHGLVPGELNGLTQPALALSSPAVTGESGDGLLTMEEILGLKLDADWVVLSACNTGAGAGAGAGAEAASGLGRASCGRDIAVPATLLAERDDLLRKCDDLRDELKRARNEIKAIMRRRKSR